MQARIIHDQPGARMTATGKAASLVCDSWLDFVSFAAARVSGEITGPTSTTDCADVETDPKEAAWRGTRTWEQALDLARNGSPADLARVGAALDVIAATQTIERVPLRVYDVAGDTVDVGRFVSGDPLCMVTRRPQARAARPIVRLLIHIGALSDVTAEQKINRGAAIVALIDGLEDAGQRVEISICAAANHWSGATYNMRTLVKRAAEPTNRDLLAFALVNPAAQRRIDFAARCAHPEGFSGMGSTGPVKPEPGEVYIPHVTSDSPTDTPARAVEYVRGLYAGAVEKMRGGD